LLHSTYLGKLVTVKAVLCPRSNCLLLLVL